ncbi:MAG: O-antigen polysaccharide polymerase Wzy [Paludibacter sp.]
MKLINISIAHFIFLTYIISSSFLLPLFPQEESTVLYTQIVLLTTFFWTLFAQIKLNGAKHLFTIFLALFFLFLLSLPFFDLIGLVELDKKYLFVPIKLTNDIDIRVYTFSTQFIAVSFLGVLFGHSNKPKSDNELLHKDYLYTGGIILFIIALPGILTKYYLQMKVILQQGYLSIYNGSLQNIDYPIICTGAGTLLIIGYCIFISSKPSKKQYLIITTIFILTQILNGLKGQRSVLMFPLVFSTWYYMKFFTTQVAVRKIIFLILIVAIAAQGILMLRHKKKYLSQKESFTDTYITNFFVQQGVTFFIQPYILHYGIKNESYPYLLAPLDFRSYGKPQTLDRLQKFNYLPDKLMYRMLPNGFKEGGGVGSSITAIFYDLPRWVSFILCFLGGFLISKFENNVKNYRLLLVSSYYIVYAVTSSIRYEPLQLFYDLLIVLVIYTLIDLFHSRAQLNKKLNE